ncbi:MAG: SusC/RagA family TonB-linked outer membrane protein [Bacteroidales bacterium]|nr:SusC/RagA family TonB-linked outer membrane protein [Bacteroidales bacterium]
MKINRITIKLLCTIMLFSLSQMIYAQENSDSGSEQNDSTAAYLEAEEYIDLGFQKLSSDRITGSVTVIDVEEALKRDHRTSVSSVLNGKVPGVFGAYDIWGTGNSVVLVDGIPQGDFYLGGLKLLEVESIVVLKDAISKAMYGAQGDNGIILINTKRGEIGDNKLRVFGEYGISTPRAMPEYLNAADYMEKYSEAQLNDGVDPASLRFSQEAIDATRSGENPARYPDNSFYTPEYIKDYTTGASVFADVRGGNKNVRYYVNSFWSQNNGWLNTSQQDITNLFNFRGNLDFIINEYMDMSIDALARVTQNEKPNAPDFWNTASEELPNSYPMLWDPNLIANDSIRDFILTDAQLSDGQLLGGNSSFQDNEYGSLSRNGNKRLLQREVQFNTKLNLDLSFITKGLSAGASAGMNLFNSLTTQQNSQFAVYEPFFDEVTEELDSVVIHGTDVSVNNFGTNDGNSTFFRQVTYFGTMNYERSFGAHDINAAAVFYNGFFNEKDEIQKDVLYHTGFTANYMYSKKYVAEFSLMGIGSRKLEKDSRVEMAPTVGVGWILSEEDFMANGSFFDYLKFRSSYGISKNDHWDYYYLYKSIYSIGNRFFYGDGNYYNSRTEYASVPNQIWLQKRRDISVGFDAVMLNRALNLEVGYFNSASLDNITLMSSTYPQIIGFEGLVYNNYNSEMEQGVELGLDYTYNVANDLSITAGVNLIYSSPKITKREESNYEGEDVALIREGTASDAMWALKSDGLYSENDFNPDGTLIDGLPVPTYGSVQAGDIKYLDQNSDNIIDQNDIRIIGHGVRTQYGLFLNIRFKNIEFYALGIGRMGDSNYRSGDYFRVYSNDKYSVMVNDAYGPDNMDVNAIHPRLSTTNGSHNNRNSDYWMYENNTFEIPTMQITYHFGGRNKAFLSDSRLYVRANNILINGKNTQYTEVNPGGTPRTKGFTMGLLTSF